LVPIRAYVAAVRQPPLLPLKGSGRGSGAGTAPRRIARCATNGAANIRRPARAGAAPRRFCAINYFLEYHPKLAPPEVRGDDEHDCRSAHRPLRAGDKAVARRCRATLVGWQVIEINVDIAESAARLRASLQLKLPDAVQAASALAINAAAIVAHDRDFPRVHSLRIIS
jgi:hypothetical protein